MFNLFGGNCGCNSNDCGSSTILWFIILFLLLFFENCGCGCNERRNNDCGCGC